ncbi:hypothetical protein BC833DRAFT_588125 [Globomyces pollinis-pini]|nr:hypothetical protein BC833DRAFT_588125 [Globomyces pollinis-pini]
MLFITNCLLTLLVYAQSSVPFSLSCPVDSINYADTVSCTVRWEIAKSDVAPHPRPNTYRITVVDEANSTNTLTRSYSWPQTTPITASVPFVLKPAEWIVASKLNFVLYWNLINFDLTPGGNGNVQSIAMNVKLDKGVSGVNTTDNPKVINIGNSASSAFSTLPILLVAFIRFL